MSYTALYIGQYTQGCTSYLRGEAIKKIVSKYHFIDTNIPFNSNSKLIKSLGFRFYIGPLINLINEYIVKNTTLHKYDIIWIDKGVFIKTKTLEYLKSKCDILIHYTPDMAFHANNSHLFNKGINFYDYVITTKMNEIDLYKSKLDQNKIIYTSQSFSPSIHKSYHSFQEKDDTLIFIGLYEDSRAKLISELINNDIKVKLIGQKWNSFVLKNKFNKNMIYLGPKIFGHSYGKLISQSKFGLGLISKKIPELHTTRTFEIPACGTALLTEKNKETSNFFNDDEVIFYNNPRDIIDKIKYYTSNENKLENLIQKGSSKVITSFTNELVIKKILASLK